MAAQLDNREIYLQEQIARIKQMTDDSDRARAESNKARAETQAMPNTLAYQAMLAGAGLFGAGVALATFLFAALK